jgi:dTDP-4-amino-4,6-dideoxygalactose transaminase
MSNVPLVDLGWQHRQVADQVQAAMAEVLERTAFILGPQVAAFEQAFAEYCGAGRCVGVASGTDAIELALRALDIGPGSEVILPANTFIATALAVVRAGATPVLVDCDARHQLIDPAKIGPALSPKTRAVIGVDLFGQAAPFDAVASALQDAGRDDVMLVEDAAQAHGAYRHGKRAGTLGRIAAFSFYPGKNLGAYGDGGAVVSDEDELADALRALRNYGSDRKYSHPIIGFNSRLDTLQAVVLSAKLERLDAWNGLRREAAARYDALLAELPTVSGVPTAEGNEHVFHLYVVRVPERDRVLSELHAAGIGAGIHYPTPIHRTGAFAHLGQGDGAFPQAEQAGAEILSLPLFPGITADQQARVVEALRAALP